MAFPRNLKSYMTKGAKRRKVHRKRKVTQAIQKPLSATNDLFHVFKTRQFHSSFLATGATTDVVSGSGLVLTGTANLTALSALFDQYRIDYIEYQIKSIFDSTGVNAYNATTLPYTHDLYVAIDKDSTAPTPNTVAGVTQYASCQAFSASDKNLHIIRFKPGVLTGAWNGSTVGAAVRTISPWIDFANSDIIHYGIVYALPGLGGATTFPVFSFNVFYGISCRAVR